jgi:hypothetical protein
MSGKLQVINQARNQRKKKQRASIHLVNEAKKKAKLLLLEPCTPTPLQQSRIVCFSCGSNDGVEVSHLCTSNLKPVSECQFGRDSRKDENYQHVLEMIDIDVIHEIVVFIVNRELHKNRKKQITAEEVQKNCGK